MIHLLLVTVSRRDIEGTLDDLVNLLLTEADPYERLLLLMYAHDVMEETLGPATDKALYDLHMTMPIDDIVPLIGWKKWRITRDVRRHREILGVPPKHHRPKPLHYVPIV
jgi:hypothetical protein